MSFDAASFAPEHFRWDFSDGVATVTLDRPQRKNPLTFESYAELRDTFRALNDDSHVKVVVLTGAGAHPLDRGHDRLRAGADRPDEVAGHPREL